MPVRDRFKRILRGPQESDLARTRHSLSGNPSDSEPHSGSAEGLWKEAYEELEKEDPKLIDAYQRALLRECRPDPADTNHDGQMRALIEQQLDRIQQSRLKITVAGKEIVAKD